MNFNERKYGIIKAIDEDGKHGTIAVGNWENNNVTYENIYVIFVDEPQSAITGDESKLEIGKKVSFLAEENKRQIYARKLRTFDNDDSEDSLDYDSGENTDSCEDYERIFADKHLGIVARERDGHYGSICLYDDYGDESEA